MKKFVKIYSILKKMKEFQKNSFNFKEKLKNILMIIKNSSENKIFKKKKHWVLVWVSYSNVLGFGYGF